MKVREDENVYRCIYMGGGEKLYKSCRMRLVLGVFPHDLLEGLPLEGL